MVSRGVKLFFHCSLLLLGLVARAEAGGEFIVCRNYMVCFDSPCPSYDAVFLSPRTETMFLFPDTETILLPIAGRVRGVDLDVSGLPQSDWELERKASGWGARFVYEGDSSFNSKGFISLRARRIVRETSMYERVMCP